MDELVGELRLYLRRFGRRLRLRDGWLLAQRSLWIACLVAALIQLAGRVWPVERLWLWTLLPLVAWLLAALGISLFRPMSPMLIARRADAELHLKERLATALELEGWKDGRTERWKNRPLDDASQSSNHPPKGTYGPIFHSSSPPTIQPSNLPALQRKDALSKARAIDPRRAFPLHWLRQSLLLAAILVGATVVLTLVPNPMDAVLAERAAVAQAAEAQAEQIKKLRQEIGDAQELKPEAREEMLRQLAELVEQLRANPGDREQALADLSRVEDALRRKLDPNSDARQAALEALAAQLQAFAGEEAGEPSDLSDAAQALDELAEDLAQMDAEERESLAGSLAQAAAQAAQAGDGDLAQALATLAQAAQSGDAEAVEQAAQAAAQALAQAQDELAQQAVLEETLSELQAGRQAIAEAGQGQAVAQGQAPAQSQGQGQGQGQGGQPGSGGGTQADTLPPASRTGRADRPQGEGPAGATGELDQQVFVPWERLQGDEELFIPGQDTGQGETQTREQDDPLPGASGPVLVPYQEVYYDYLDAANQTMERSYIPSGLKDYVRKYFSQLEP